MRAAATGSGIAVRFSRPRRGFLRTALGVGAAALAARGGLALAEPLDERWVATKRATPLWIDADGHDIRWLKTGTLLRVGLSAKGTRLWAWCPAFGTFGSVESASVTDAPAPSESDLLAQRTGPILPPVISAGEMPARSVGAARIRSWPDGNRSDTLVRELSHNMPLTVVEVVQGDDGETWYRVAADAGGPKALRGAALFVHNSFVRLPRTDFHPLSANPDRGPTKWFEADLETPAMLTAYEANRPVWSSLTLHGTRPNLTPSGDHEILWRVANETMSSERVYPPIPRNAPGGYYLTGVLYTQYFSPIGAAIHYNYWSSAWGYGGTHGCLGLPLTEAKWAWDWASTGTPVRVIG